MSARTITLPVFDDAGAPSGTENHDLGAPGPWTTPDTPLTSRVAFAAAHVIPHAGAGNVPGEPASVDWDSTLAYRHRIWSYGLGVADAMDTAQRGMGLDWAATQELVRRSAAEAAAFRSTSDAGHPARVACGAGTDQLSPAAVAALEPGEAGLAAVTGAYREQVHVVQDAGAQVIVMASRALARVARGPEDYARVYDAVLAEADQPVVLHWLGTMFDPALEGYWGSTSVADATNVFLDVIRAHQAKVDGVKVSLLDAAHEVGLRRALAALEPVTMPAGFGVAAAADAGVGGARPRLYTGDDFNYPELIAGDEQGHSDALLGIFAAIYPAASTALQAFDAAAAGDAVAAKRGHEILAATEALGRKIFEAPTYYYKTGIAFLSWLNGFQPAFSLVGGLHSGRSVAHLVELFRLADGCGMLLDPELAARRMRAFLTVNGVDA
ncbi:dihydrodipicolinate synthase family protein [Myceligenerans pegani]|uniref:Dihydrodipicolinate synthase family protein n=1 Tax=Myceligenerans pegani TaxID=2776917 RepID=A0ABR9N4X8_9MICO|nr:dihydrodipicolinate synthase family protein [Myceligenerans sp. TRM 65318]MBE1878731.1 dihydrodipicolinate synthase family protein [Myceligenerans sp. TRM 65318]MBE3021002.1 dihydrodipicolinate synthase family protein [Myceligenerans sp. TRM 65318]